MTEDTLLTLALALIPGVGPRTQALLTDRFGSAQAVFGAGRDAVVQAGLSPRIAATLFADGVRAKAEQVAGLCERSGIRILVRGTDEFPKAFGELCSDAPHVLYVRGEIDFNRGQWISIVGTRDATSYGTEACEQIVRDAAEMLTEPIVVSGLAFGIDKEAHLAALQHRVPTVAVMAGWVDDIVPRTHFPLARRILTEGGAVISDMPPGTVIDRGNFLSRNRIVAGISRVTIVVESAERGGSLVTADLADSYGKELFAVPGRMGDPRSQGTNLLIGSNKAMMYRGMQQVAEAAGWIAKPAGNRPTPDAIPEHLPPRQKLFLEQLAGGVHVGTDELAERLGWSVGEVSSVAGQLRVMRLIDTDPYKLHYRIC